MSETVLFAGRQAQCEGVQERGQGEPHGFLIVSEVTVQQVHVDAGVTVEGGAQVSGFTDHAGAARVVAVVNSRIIIVLHVCSVHADGVRKLAGRIHHVLAAGALVAAGAHSSEERDVDAPVGVKQLLDVRTMGGDGLLRIGAAVCLFRILGELLPLLFTEELERASAAGSVLVRGKAGRLHQFAGDLQQMLVLRITVDALRDHLGELTAARAEPAGVEGVAEVVANGLLPCL